MAHDQFGNWDFAYAAYSGAINLDRSTPAYRDPADFGDVARFREALASQGYIQNPAPVNGTALDWAFEALGSPYVWAGVTLDGFDCQGLVYWAYQQVGMSCHAGPPRNGTRRPASPPSAPARRPRLLWRRSLPRWSLRRKRLHAALPTRGDDSRDRLTQRVILERAPRRLRARAVTDQTNSPWKNRRWLNLPAAVCRSVLHTGSVDALSALVYAVSHHSNAFE